MGRHRDETNRVLGPTWLPSKGKWRIIVVTPKEPGAKGGRTPQFFDSEAHARRCKDRIEARWALLDATTIGDAIKSYERHLADKGTGEDSRAETTRRLRLFFPSLAMTVSAVTPGAGKAYYEAFRARMKLDRNGEPTDEPISVAYHRATLINARSFMSWCVEQGLVAANPLAPVKGVGKRGRGKEQHTGDEARALWNHCLAAAKGKGLRAQSSLAILLLVSLGLRKSDLTRRVVRDVDLDATALIVSRGKTAASNRSRRVPEILQPMLAALARGRGALEPLFMSPYTETGFYGETWINQALAKACDELGLPVVCPHSLKGVAGSMLAEMGTLADQIARHLSHESPTTTKKHYIAPGALEDAMQERGLAVLTGGRR